MTRKTCPFLLTGVLSNPERTLSDTATPGATGCMESQCQFWTSTYTTESIGVFDCAFVIAAMTNSDGRVQV